MVVKLKKNFEKTRHVKNNDKSKEYILRGERNVRYHDRILYKKKNLIISRLVVYQKAYDIRRKGLHPHPTPTSQQILPQNTNHRV